MTKPILPYTPARVAEIRSWVKDCATWLEARKTIATRLSVHEDNVTKMNRRHGFWDETKAPKVETPAPRAIRRLFLDIETSPDVVMTWRIGFKINIAHDSILRERAIICACWSWEDEKKVHYAHWDKDQDDKVILAPLLEAINEADEIVYHNGERFDMPWVKTRCLFHKLPTLPTHKGVDTLQWARRRFYFNSNKLDYIARFLGIGGKLKTGFGLWKAVVLDNCPKAMCKMVRYCQYDVILLKKVWARLAQVMPHKTHAGVLAGKDKWTCPKTGSTNVKLNKTRATAGGALQYQMYCRASGCYYTIGAAAYKAYREAKG